MATKKITIKKAKTTRKERSKIKKAEHARARERDASARARAREKEAAAAPKVIPYPQAGAKVIEFERELDRQLGGETIGAEPAAGIPTEPGKVISFDHAVIAQVCQIPFDLWSISQGVDQLKLSDKEARMMAKPAKELLDYYLPQIPVIAWAWISLAVVSYSTLKIRLLIIQEIKKRADRIRGPAAEASGASSTVSQPQGQGRPPPSGIATTFPTMDQIKTQAV